MLSEISAETFNVKRGGEVEIPKGFFSEEITVGHSENIFWKTPRVE